VENATKTLESGDVQSVTSADDNHYPANRVPQNRVKKRNQLDPVRMPMQLADRQCVSKIWVWDLNKVLIRFGLPVSAEGSFLGFA